MSSESESNATPLFSDGETKRPVTVSHLNDESFSAPGRRSYARYRNLGLGAATDHRQGAVVIDTNATVPQPTGWHYHTCEVQFVYVLKGSVTLEFEDGSSERMQAGSCVTIPGGVCHNESQASADIEVLEITVPAKIGTVAVENPLL
jgi:quercetin dioxygenase-like cupin family protein